MRQRLSSSRMDWSTGKLLTRANVFARAGFKGGMNSTPGLGIAACMADNLREQVMALASSLDDAELDILIRSLAQALARLRAERERRESSEPPSRPERN